MSRLLINEPPLQVLPTLATAVGLNEALVLQQLHYWLSMPKIGKMHNGKKWIYNSVNEWKKDNFPFWSIGTIRRTLESLKDQNLILAENLNDKPYDRTLWYTIDYDHLYILQQSILSKCTNGSDRIAQMEVIDMGKPIPENTQEKNTDITLGKKNGNYPSDAVGSNNEEITQLITLFTEKTALFPPHDTTHEYKENWYLPMERLQTAYPADAPERIETAIKALREKRYTIKTPNSIYVAATNSQPEQRNLGFLPGR